jgi:hypothetical protein
VPFAVMLECFPVTCRYVPLPSEGVAAVATQMSQLVALAVALKWPAGHRVHSPVAVLTKLPGGQDTHPFLAGFANELWHLRQAAAAVWPVSFVKAVAGSKHRVHRDPKFSDA